MFEYFLTGELNPSAPICRKARQRRKMRGRRPAYEKSCTYSSSVFELDDGPTGSFDLPLDPGNLLATDQLDPALGIEIGEQGPLQVQIFDEEAHVRDHVFEA